MAKVLKLLVKCFKLFVLNCHLLDGIVFFFCKKPEENQSNFLLGLFNDAGDNDYNDLDDGNDSMRTKTQGALELY